MGKEEDELKGGKEGLWGGKGVMEEEEISGGKAEEEEMKSGRSGRLRGNSGTFLQTSMKVGPANDQYEQEADAMANKVVSGGKCESCGEKEEEKSGGIRRMPSIQMKGGDVPEVSASLEGRINSRKGNGSAMPESVQSRMESGFDADFGGVNIHTGSEADKMNREIGAEAFTTGYDIFFSKGSYDPYSSKGQRLLAHELTHTIQQGAVGGKIQRSGDTPKLGYTTNNGPTLNTCGEFTWGVQWKLSAPANKTNGGWVVQKINFDVSGTKDAGGDVAFSDIGGNSANIPFWEAWRIPPGKDITDFAVAGDPYDDTYMVARGVNNASGTVKITGDAQYYDNMPDAPDGMTQNSHPYAGILYASMAQPSDLSGGTGAIEHNATSTWDCTSTSSDNSTSLTRSPDQ